MPLIHSLSRPMLPTAFTRHFCQSIKRPTARTAWGPPGVADALGLALAANVSLEGYEDGQHAYDGAAPRLFVHALEDALTAGCNELILADQSIFIGIDDC